VHPAPAEESEHEKFLIVLVVFAFVAARDLELAPADRCLGQLPELCGSGLPIGGATSEHSCARDDYARRREPDCLRLLRRSRLCTQQPQEQASAAVDLGAVPLAERPASPSLVKARTGDADTLFCEKARHLCGANLS
jgi:hypothetical protein